MMEIRDMREMPWFWAPNEILDTYGKQIGPYGIAVYMALARFASKQSQQAIPSIKTVSEKIGVSRNKVKEVLHRLEQLGLVRISARYSEDGDRTSNSYALLTPAVGEVGHTMADGGSPGGLRVGHPVAPNYTTSEQSSSEQTSSSFSSNSKNETLLYSGSFDRFWSAYPKKVGKDKAWEAWKKKQCERQSDAIVTKVEEQKTWAQWTKENGEFIPHPATYLNQGRWKDESSEWKPEPLQLIPPDPNNSMLAIMRNGHGRSYLEEERELDPNDPLFED